MAKEIFISYSRKDFDKVKAIKDEIDRELGVNCWMDLDGIESGDQFKNVIISAINSHDTFLFMLSPNSMQSEWALDELDFAKRKKKRIVLVYVEPCEMTDDFYFTYHKYDSIDWSDALQQNKLMCNFKSWYGKKQHEQSFIPLQSDPSRPMNIEIENAINESYTKGKNLYYAGQYGQALQILKLAADNGHADAQYFSGLICFMDYCGIKEFTQAAYWYEKAAEQGHQYAQFQLAYLYEHGIGIASDYKKAVYWYTKSAEQQDPDACYALGNIYEKGKEVEQNDETAFQYYFKAASIGTTGHCSTAPSILKVAQMYEYGVGTTLSEVQAAKWYKKYIMFMEEDNRPFRDREKILNKIRELESKK